VNGLTDVDDSLIAGTGTLGQDGRLILYVVPRSVMPSMTHSLRRLPAAERAVAAARAG
jgi:hypothetical protein